MGKYTKIQDSNKGYRGRLDYSCDERTSLSRAV